MSKRVPEELRLEIASERKGLADDVDVLRDEVRALKPVAIAGVVAVVLLSLRRYVKSGIRLLWRLR
jgi:hypothetical protein